MFEAEPLLKILRRAEVELILVGGFAGIVHGSARLTQDLDIVYRRTPENIRRLADVLKSHSPYLRGAPPRLPFQCLTLDRLIEVKRAAGRPKDFEAISELEALRGEPLP